MDSNKILFFFSSLLFISSQVLPVFSLDGSSVCMVKLLPCKEYFKGDAEPPATCCDPLSEIVLNDPTCLCQAISHPSVSDSMNITLHDALELTNKCGAKVDSSVCDEAALLAAEASPSPNAQAATSAEMADSLLASLGNSTNSTTNSSVDAAHSLLNSLANGSSTSDATSSALAAGPTTASPAPAPGPSTTDAKSSATITSCESFGFIVLLVASYVSTIFLS